MNLRWEIRTAWRRRVRCIAFGLAAIALMACAGLRSARSSSPPQDSSSTLRVQVRLVSLFVNVTDAHGAPVGDLSKDNFALSEDGLPQTISIFERDTNTPLSLVLAIDTSGSTRRDLNAEQHAGRDFAQALLTPKDQLALFDFNSDVREVVPFTNNIRHIESGLGSLGHGPATAFYQAIYLAADALAPRSGRKVLLVISDGGNTVKGTSYDDALAEAQRSDIIIYSLIDTPIEADAGRDTAGEHAMITLSQDTGGRAFYVKNGGLAAAFRKVSDDLRTQYLLAYYPARGGQPSNPLASGSAFHTVHIVLRNTPVGAEDTPHYRDGYYRTAASP